MKVTLSTICIALLALFAYQVMSYPMVIEESINGKELAKSIDYDLPQLAVLKSIDQYSEIVQRPLFAQDRAAAINTATVNKVTTVAELSHLILVGTASSSDVEIAIIADTKAKQMERLKVGETYKQWEIAEISSDHIVFQNSKLEYKLFVTPIKGSHKDKQKKLISNLNKSKIERTATPTDNISSNVSSSDNSKQKAVGKIWGNYKKLDQNKINNSGESKSVRRSPIKIPGEEERDAAYYEGEGDDVDSVSANNRDSADNEIDIGGYYDNEDLTEDEIKELEELGLRILDD